jgi:hypothetical protein
MMWSEADMVVQVAVNAGVELGRGWVHLENRFRRGAKCDLVLVDPATIAREGRPRRLEAAAPAAEFKIVNSASRKEYSWQGVGGDVEKLAALKRDGIIAAGAVCAIDKMGARGRGEGEGREGGGQGGDQGVGGRGSGVARVAERGAERGGGAIPQRGGEGPVPKVDLTVDRAVRAEWEDEVVRLGPAGFGGKLVQGEFPWAQEGRFGAGTDLPPEVGISFDEVRRNPLRRGGAYVKELGDEVGGGGGGQLATGPQVVEDQPANGVLAGIDGAALFDLQNQERFAVGA